MLLLLLHCLKISPAKVGILIDSAGNACISNFSQLVVISDPENTLYPSAVGGTVGWMSPELIAPGEFGLEKSLLTKSSDCYALGMVLYETISGNLPFYEHADAMVLMQLMGGGHPTRSMKFSENLWEVLEQCWAAHPNDRPSVEDVLQRLRGISNSSRAGTDE